MKVLSKQWGAIFGVLAKELSLGYIKGDTLVIYTQNAAWIHEISYYQEAFLAKISEALKAVVIKRIKVMRGDYRQTNERGRRKTVVKADESVISLSLEDKIKNENLKKKKLGYTLCQQCGKVWGVTAVCLYCDIKEKKGGFSKNG